jgi:hypothetical protein
MLFPLALLACDVVDPTFNPFDTESEAPVSPLDVEDLGRQATCWVSIDRQLVAIGLESEEQVVLGDLPAATQTWATDGESIIALGGGVWVAPLDTLEFTEVVDAPAVSSAIWTGARWVTYGSGGSHQAASLDDLLASNLEPIEEADFSGWGVMAGIDDTLVEVTPFDELVTYTLPDGERTLEAVNLRRTQWAPSALAITADHAITMSSIGDGTLRGTGVYLRQFDRETGQRLATLQIDDRFGGTEGGLACAD